MPQSHPVSVLHLSSNQWLSETTSLDQFLNDRKASKLLYLFLADDIFKPDREIPPDLSGFFHLPKCMVTNVYRQSNGFFNFEQSLDKNGHLKSYYTSFRFLVKSLLRKGSSDYVWHEMTFLSSWNNEQCIVFCIGVDLTFQSTLRGVLSGMWPELPPFEPYTLHVPIVETIIAMQDTSVWSTRDIVRKIEKDRSRPTRGSQDFLMLHETARHAIHSFETLKVTVQTLEALQQQVKNVSSNRQDNEKQANAPHQIWTQVDFQVRMLRNLLHRSQSNKERLQNEISLAYNMIAQRDSQVMTGLGEASKRDSEAMRTIAVVTMAFLPPTFISAVFSMSFFNYSPAQDGQANAWSISDKFWIYWAFAVPLTCLTMAVWFWQQNQKRNGKRTAQT